jgi:hypothetical protein
VLRAVNGLLLALTLFGSPAPGSAAAAEPELSLELQRLWHRTITPRLAREPWTGPQRYDAAYLFMVPLHAAFEQEYEKGQLELADHVARFLLHRESVSLTPDTQVSWLQYFYLLSRFTVLAADHGRADLIPPELPEALRGWMEQIWVRAPAWQWFRRPFPGGVRERLEWKLSGFPSLGGRSYEHAILDQELFVFAIAADLRQYGRRVGTPLAGDPLLEEIGRFARRTYVDRVVWNANGGWTFQPGLWRDHPDHQHGCWVDKRLGLRACSIPRGAEDASHSHRSPLWLRSLAEAAPPESAERAYYERLLRGLERQLFDRVLVPPSPDFPGWRLSNYMDGWNGLYRWGYHQFGPDEGYGPYELSFVLLSGWWSFLPGQRTRGLYRDLASAFPLSPELLQVYMGPPPLGRPPGRPNGILVDGTAKLLCRLGAGPAAVPLFGEGPASSVSSLSPSPPPAMTTVSLSDTVAHPPDRPLPFR